MAWYDKVAHHSWSSPLPVIPKLSYELHEAYIERENFLNGMENKALFNQNGFVLKAKENRPVFFKDQFLFSKTYAIICWIWV